MNVSDLPGDQPGDLLADLPGDLLADLEFIGYKCAALYHEYYIIFSTPANAIIITSYNVPSLIFFK